MYLICDWVDEVDHYNLPDIYRAELQGLCDKNDIKLIFCPDETSWPEIDNIFAYVGNRPTMALLSAKRIRWIHFGSVGTDRIDLSQANAKGVRITNAAGVFTRSVALHTVARILRFLALGGSDQPAEFTRKAWERNAHKVSDARVTVLGHGDIGRLVSEMLDALRINVHAMTRRPRQHQAKYPMMDLFNHQTMQSEKCEILVNLLPFTADTSGLLDKSFFSRFASIEYYLNVGRQQTEDLEAVLHLLDLGHIKRAGWDVIRDSSVREKIESRFGCRVDFTPHIASFSEDHWPRSFQLVRNNLFRVLNDDYENMENLLNA